MPFRINHYPSKQKPDPVRPIYEHLKYYDPASYPAPSRYQTTNTIRTAHNLHPNKFNIQAFQQSRARRYHERIPRTLIAEQSDDYFHEVTATSENRLDWISNKFYGTSIYWWVIAEANTSILFDPMNIPRGTILRIPPITRLYEGGVI